MEFLHHIFKKSLKNLEVTKKIPIFASRELGHCQRSPVNPVEAPSSCQVIAKGSRSLREGTWQVFKNQTSLGFYPITVGSEALDVGGQL